MEGSSNTKGIVVAVVVVIVVVLVGLYLYRGSLTTPVSEEVEEGAGLSEVQEEEASLGGELFEKVNNPVQDELPDAVAPVSNPLEEVYNNPFE